MSLAGSDHHVTDRTVTARREVIVVGGGQAGLAIGYFLARQGRDFTILEAAGSRRPRGASAGTRSSCSRRPATTALPGLAFPGDPERYPGSRRGRGLPDRLRPSLRPAGRAQQPRPLDPQDATAPTWSSSTTGPTRPTRWWSPRARSRCRWCRRSPSASTQVWCSSTAARIGRRGPSRTGRFSWSVVATPGSRSPRSSPASREVHLSIGVASDAAAAAHPRPRPVLVPRRDRADPQDDRVADRAPDVRARHARSDRAPVACAAARGRAPRAGGRTSRGRPSASRTAPTSSLAASSGRPASESITRGSMSRSSTRTAASCTGAA